MGWLFSQGQTRSELIARRNKEWETETHKGKTIRHAARGNVLWAIREVTDKTTGKIDTYIACDLMQGQRGYGWGYKDMSEDMGPHYYTCPLSYLEQVPAPNGEYSKGWREKVKAYHARRNRKFTIGQAINLIGYEAKAFIISLKPLMVDYNGGKYNVSLKQIA